MRARSFFRGDVNFSRCVLIANDFHERPENEKLLFCMKSREEGASVLLRVSVGIRTRRGLPQCGAHGPSPEQKHDESKRKEHDSPPKINVDAQGLLVARGVPEQAVSGQDDSEERK